MTELKSIWSGSFNLFGVDVKCHTLDDGQRIIEADSLEALLDAVAQPDICFEGDLAEFQRWRSAKDITPK